MTGEFDLAGIVETVAKYLAMGWTKERVRPYLPMLRDELKGATLEEKITLAVTLKERFPDFADIVNELIEVPPAQPQSTPPLPEEPEPQDLTEDEELKIARYTDQQLKGGNSLYTIRDSVNVAFNTDLEVRELQGIVQRYRIGEAWKERKVAAQVTAQKVNDLQAQLQAEKEAHLVTKQGADLKYNEYREGIVVKWGASLVGVLGLGLALGRLLR